MKSRLCVLFARCYKHLYTLFFVFLLRSMRKIFRMTFYCGLYQVWTNFLKRSSGLKYLSSSRKWSHADVPFGGGSCCEASEAQRKYRTMV